jgi:Ser/Thr protein kinase RdoA (MazF antagonist)
MSELTWLTDLRRSGVAQTPVIVPGKDGEWLQMAGHPELAERRNVVMTEWERGIEPQISDDLLPAFAKLGELAARMHVHVQTWQRPEWFTRFTWNFDTALGDDRPHWGRWRDGMGVDAATAELFGRTVVNIGRRLQRYGTSAGRFGLIHADLRLANLLVDGTDVKVLDFDDSGFGWFMYDAAAAVSFYEHEPQIPDLIASWKEGYRKVRSLSKEDETEIETFILFRRLLLVAWIGSHSDTELARSMGLDYTAGSAVLCDRYLTRMA